jgi:ribosome-binding factor A
MSHHRSEKITELLRHVAAQFIQTESNRTSLITVTGINLSPDEKHATILVTIYPTDREHAAIEFLQRKRSEFRDYVKKETRLRVLPFVEFALDKGEKNRQKIDELSDSN